MHTFPSVKDGSCTERYLQWIEKSGNKLLLDLPPKSLNRRFFMCEDHFDEFQYVSPAKRRRLRMNGVPSINCNFPLSLEDVAAYKAKFLSFHAVGVDSVGHDHIDAKLSLESNSKTDSRGFNDDSHSSSFTTLLHVTEKFGGVSSTVSSTRSDGFVAIGTDVALEGVRVTSEFVCDQRGSNVDVGEIYEEIVTDSQHFEVPFSIQEDGNDDSFAPDHSCANISTVSSVSVGCNEPCSSRSICGSDVAKNNGGLINYVMAAGINTADVSEREQLKDVSFEFDHDESFASDHNYAKTCSSDNSVVSSIGLNEQRSISKSDIAKHFRGCECISDFNGSNSIVFDFEENQEVGDQCIKLNSEYCQDIGVKENCKEVVVENQEVDSVTEIKRRIQKRCVVDGCLNNNSTHTMYGFPRVLRLISGKHVVDENWMERCLVWVKFCGNWNVVSNDVSLLHKLFFMCDAHFDLKNSYVLNGKKRLRNGAVPKLCAPTPLPDGSIEAYRQSNRKEAESVLDDAETSEINIILRRQPCDKIGDLKCARSKNLSRKFEDKVKSFKMEFCDVCKEKYMTYPGMKRAHRSKKCCRKFSDANNLDPGEVPSCLRDLTFIEEQLIARVHPVLCVYKLKGLQYGYKGNVISFCQDVKTFALQLPHRIEDLSSVITVRFENHTSEYSDFRVRAGKVREALVWLKANNEYYENIEISNENLESLPEDECVFDIVMSMSLTKENGSESEEEEDKDILERDENSVVSDEDDVSVDAVDDSSDEDDIVNINESGVPSANFSCQNDHIRAVLDWPKQSSDPLSESTPGLIVCAFPTLFPFGKCDLNDYREYKVKMHEYFKHFLCFGDERFAQHRTFRFFAFNMWMRHTALTSGNVFVSADHEVSKMNVEQLKERIEANPNIMKKLMFMGSNIRGSKAYWKSRCGELRDMIEQLGLPTIFLTMSAADMYWPDLFLLLTGKNISEISMSERRRLLQDNPLIVDMFFQFRLECFIENILEPKFGVVDFWYRIEYQHRGSPHVHGLFWLKDGPDVTNLSNASSEEREKVCEYFSSLVCAVNPRKDCGMPENHPCEILFQDVTDVEVDLAQLLKKVQRHSCSKEYCKRFDKKSKKTICRFHFPMDIQESAEIRLNSESNEVEFLPERNDEHLNKFNPFIISTWRANIDIAPVLSKKAVIEYLTKYVSKSEVRSNTLEEICSIVCNSLNATDKARRAIQKILIKNCVDRDLSAQEVCHILMGSKLFSAGGRNFVVLYTSDSKWIPVKVHESEESGSSENLRGKSFMQKYVNRPDNLESMSLWDIAKYYNVRSWRPGKKTNIVRVFPRLKLCEHEEKNEDFFRQKVLLHVPWRDQNMLKTEGEKWKNVYERHCVGEINVNGINVDFAGRPEQVEDEEDDNIVHESERNEDWMIASRLCSRGTVDPVELGRREVDVSHDWQQSCGKYDEYGDFHYFKNFIEMEKKKDTDFFTCKDLPDVIFSKEQQAVRELMDCQVGAMRKGSLDSVPKRVLVQGKAGTGKSLLIKYLVDRLIKEFGRDSFLLLGPTGVSAINIGGSTIHSVLKVPTKYGNYKKLSGESARKFCDQMEKVKIIIVDEYSMIGCSLLGIIDKRLREGTGVNEPFGNIIIYFFGDYKQLPPVKDVALCGGQCKSDLAQEGRRVFNSFQKYFVLKEVFRQSDDNFLQILDRLSRGETTFSDYQVLKARFTTNVDRQTSKSFDNSLRLFSTKEGVENFNKLKLLSLQDENGNLCPVARIPAVHHGAGASKGRPDDAGGLMPVLYLGTGTRIMLRSNLWVKKGLVNGAMGTVVDLLYEVNKQSPDNPPSLLMVKFDNYQGPGIGPDCLVPVSAVVKTWATHGSEKHLSRQQFPVVVCYGCSIHKSQGLTLDQAVIDIGPREFAIGLSYVGLSRVKSIDGLLLEPFSFERLQGIKAKKDLMFHRNFEETLQLS